MATLEGFWDPCTPGLKNTPEGRTRGAASTGAFNFLVFFIFPASASGLSIINPGFFLHVRYASLED